MACGCGRKNIMPRSRTLQPTIGPRSVTGGVAAGPTPSEVRILNMQKMVAENPPQPTGQDSMSEQRRKLEMMRRAVLKRKMG